MGSLPDERKDMGVYLVTYSPWRPREASRMDSVR